MIYGLLASLGWGASDFGAAVAGRRIGSFPTVIVAQLLSTFAVTVALVASGEGVSGLRPLLPLLVVNGVATSAAYALHYRALEIGPVAVVSPVSASYAVVGVALAIAILDERPGVLALIGAVVTVAGVMLTSTDLPKLRAGTHGVPAGLPWALGAAVGFGVAAFTLGWAVQRVGWLEGLWASRIAQMVCYAPFVAIRPKRFRGLARVGVGVALLVGATDLVGLVSFSRGAEAGFLTIVLAASAVFPVIAVALSIGFLRERPVFNQYVGIGVVAIGLLMLGLA